MGPIGGGAAALPSNVIGQDFQQSPLTAAFYDIAYNGRHPLALQLYQAGYAESRNEAAAEIAIPAQLSIKMLFEEYKRAGSTCRTAEEAFAMVTNNQSCNCNAVLIAVRELLQPGSVDFSIVPRHFIYEFASKFRAYEMALGQFLPTALFKLAEPIVAKLAFDTPSVETSRYRDDVREYLRRLNLARDIGGGNIGIPSGYRPLDDLMGGFSGTTTVGGNSGAGKTDFLISCVAHILSTASDVAVFIVSADLSKQRMFDRLMCCLAQFSESDLYQVPASDDNRQRLDSAASLLAAATARFQIVEVNDSQFVDVNSLLRLRDGLVEGSRCKRLLIVIDYLQVLRFDSVKGDLHESERHRFSEVKRLAKPSPIHSALGEFPLAIISEVRKGDGNGGLELEDLSGTARHYYGADNVLLLETSAEGDDSADSQSVSVAVSVKKARRGHKGQLTLTFDYPRHSFRFKTVKIEAGTKPKRPRLGGSST